MQHIVFVSVETFIGTMFAQIAYTLFLRPTRLIHTMYLLSTRLLDERFGLMTPPGLGLGLGLALGLGLGLGLGGGEMLGSA